MRIGALEYEKPKKIVHKDYLGRKVKTQTSNQYRHFKSRPKFEPDLIFSGFYLYYVFIK